tara:strand:- start:3709 stop:3900 length:192 start_codon:yes stop_codon:yes gene_type:complete
MNKSYYQDVPVFIQRPKKARRMPRPAMVFEIKKARALRGEGLTYEQIGKQLDRHASTIYGWLR